MKNEGEVFDSPRCYRGSVRHRLREPCLDTVNEAAAPKRRRVIECANLDSGCGELHDSSSREGSERYALGRSPFLTK